MPRDSGLGATRAASLRVAALRALTAEFSYLPESGAVAVCACSAVASLAGAACSWEAAVSLAGTGLYPPILRSYPVRTGMVQLHRYMQLAASATPATNFESEIIGMKCN